MQIIYYILTFVILFAFSDLSDAEAKEKCMISLLFNLPEPNFSTIVYLLEHLVR